MRVFIALSLAILLVWSAQANADLDHLQTVFTSWNQASSEEKTAVAGELLDDDEDAQVFASFEFPDELTTSDSVGSFAAEFSQLGANDRAEFGQHMAALADNYAENLSDSDADSTGDDADRKCENDNQDCLSIDRVKAQCKQDIVVVLDGSGSLSASEWEKSKTFAKNLADTVDPVRTRLALVQFSSVSNSRVSTRVPNAAAIEQSLTEDLSRFKASVNTMSHQNGDTDLAAASIMAKQALAPSTQSDRVKVVLFVTDGTNTKNHLGRTPEDAANELKASGAELIMIPIGSKVDLAQCRRMSSGIVVQRSSFEALAQSVKELYGKIKCEVPPPKATPAPTPVPSNPCQKTDFVLALDSSGTMSTQWKNVNAWVSKFIGDSPSTSRVGLVKFSSSVDHNKVILNQQGWEKKEDDRKKKWKKARGGLAGFKRKPYPSEPAPAYTVAKVTSSKSDAVNQLSVSKPLLRHTDIGQGIAKAVELFKNTPSNGSKRALIVVSDCKQNRRTAGDMQANADKARAAGIEVYALNVGGPKQLCEQIANQGVKFIQTVSSYKSLVETNFKFQC